MGFKIFFTPQAPSGPFHSKFFQKKSILAFEANDCRCDFLELHFFPILEHCALSAFCPELNYNLRIATSSENIIAICRKLNPNLQYCAQVLTMWWRNSNCTKSVTRNRSSCSNIIVESNMATLNVTFNCQSIMQEITKNTSFSIYN